VTPEQAGLFAWAVRDTLDQYLTVANEHGFTKRGQLLDLLDSYPGREDLITWIRERGNDEWAKYLDSITAGRAAWARAWAGRAVRVGRAVAVQARRAVAARTSAH
jgi:hypothetical protein